MTDQTLKDLENKIKNSTSIPDAKKAEMISLLAALKIEIGELAKTKGEAAESISGFTKISTHEAMRRAQNPHLLDLSLKGLTKSVEEFEGSHPQLTSAVNAICAMLAKLGV